VTDTSPRLNRLFASDGRCFDVAVDHGLFGEQAFLTGIEDMEAALDVLVEAAPDAIQLALGPAHILQSRPGRKPALVLRTDVANVYGAELPARLFSELVDRAAEHAVRLDAACVVVNLLLLPDQPKLLQACIRNVVALRAACESVSMPLMVEPLVMRPTEKGPYGVDGDPDRIVPLVRQAVELGADVIKADPTDNLEDYGRVVEVAGRIPVLVRGGGRAPDEELMRRTKAVMTAGASGIVYGRNVIQHENPLGMTQALMAIVHDAAPVDEALAILHG
jgi:DhnA family fructose-bisphosphate aldolase class Ia